MTVDSPIVPIPARPCPPDLLGKNNPTGNSRQDGLLGRRQWSKQTEESAVEAARTNTNLTLSQRSAFIAIARIVQYHQKNGEARSDGFVPVTLGEIANVVGCSNRTVRRNLDRAEEWGLIERDLKWSQVVDTNPKSGKREYRPDSQLLIRPTGSDFLEQVRLIATLDPGLGRNVGWGGRRDPDEADNASSIPAASGHVRVRPTGHSSDHVIKGTLKKQRVEMASQPNAGAEWTSCPTNNVPVEGDESKKTEKKKRKGSTAPILASSMLHAALGYAAKGWPVFPVHHPTDTGCSCREGQQCARPSKHPRTRSGHSAATTDPQRIRAWWTKWPAANIGISTGPAGLVVVDIDQRSGGLETWNALLEAIGPQLCDTATVMTGGGGQHLYFEAPDNGTIPSSAGALGPGIDIRAIGGYVIAPPSTHASGYNYQWSETAEAVPLSLPQELIDRLSRTNFEAKGFTPSAPVGGPIPEGRRNHVLYREACGLRGRGATEKNIYASLRLSNQQSCVPPLPDSELRSIARSAAKYTPNGLS